MRDSFAFFLPRPSRVSLQCALFCLVFLGAPITAATAEDDAGLDGGSAFPAPVYEGPDLGASLTPSSEPSRIAPGAAELGSGPLTNPEPREAEECACAAEPGAEPTSGFFLLAAAIWAAASYRFMRRQKFTVST